MLAVHERRLPNRLGTLDVICEPHRFGDGPRDI